MSEGGCRNTLGTAGPCLWAFESQRKRTQKILKRNQKNTLMILERSSQYINTVHFIKQYV